MKVGDLVDAGHADIKTGPFGTQLRASDYVEDGRPVLNVRNVGLGDVRPKDLEYVDEQTAGRLSTHILRTNDIVFGRKGAVERHAFISEQYDGAMQGSDCIRLRVFDGSPMPARFVTFALRTQQHQAWMKAFCSHGATMASLNQEIVRQIPLPEIDSAHQEWAVSVLQNIDDLIANNRRRAEVMEEMARAIYREWFVKFRYPGHEDIPLVDSALGPIPNGWEVRTVSELSSIVTRGIAPKYADDARWTVLNQRCIRDERISMGAARRQERQVAEAKQVRHGDVLINSTGVGTLGRVALYRRKQDNLTVDSHVTIARPVRESLNPWYGLTLMAKQTEFERLGTGSTGQTELSRGDIGAAQAVLPPDELLAWFASAAWPMMTQADTLLGASESMAELRDLLLPKLVTGQVDVSELDLDALVGESVA
jgi:type I restriction enzyme, S subunit